MSGVSRCKVRTEEETASAHDFVGITDMVLVFEKDESMKSFDIEIIDDDVYEKDEVGPAG